MKPARFVRAAEDGRNFTDLEPGHVRPSQSQNKADESEAPEAPTGGGLVVVDPDAQPGRNKRQGEKGMSMSKRQKATPLLYHAPNKTFDK